MSDVVVPRGSSVRGGGASPLVACILASSLVGMDSMMTTVALPAIADDLHAGLAAQQWVLAVFLLALGSLLLVGGAVGDALDRWRVFAAGTAAFGVAALVCAVAPTASGIPAITSGSSSTSAYRSSRRTACETSGRSESWTTCSAT